MLRGFPRQNHLVPHEVVGRSDRSTTSSEKQIFDQSGDRQQDQEEDDESAKAHAPHHPAAHYSVHRRQAPFFYGTTWRQAIETRYQET
jgi:hypothetical protein